ncbi:MAG: PAS domain S-box protein [Synechococcales bacterium]|nr:PAS domain S-box protein [Synechococcales bacterium]
MKPMPRPQPGDVTLDDVLITEELSRRPAREPNWRAENEALRSLTRTLVHDPEVMLQSLVDFALKLCDGGPATAGVSLVEKHPNREDVFRWVVLSGTLASQVGGCTPRNFSPCGVCLAQGTPVLFSHPERYFTYFQDANTPMVEGLVLPLMAEGQTLGTIWIISHDEQRRFDGEDVRLITGLAEFTAAALLRNQQQAQHALAESERNFRAIANIVPDLLWHSDPDGSTNWYSDRWLDYTGQTFEQAIDWGWTGVIHPDDREALARHYREAVAENRPLQQEHRIRRHDGEYRWFLIRAEPLRDEQGRTLRMYGAATDIHEQRVALQRLRESERRLLAVAENLPGGAAFIVDRDLRYQLAAGEALAIAGFEPEQLVGRTIFEVLPPELAASYEPMYRSALAGQSFEHEHQTHNRWYISRGTPLRTEDGDIYAALAVSYDITERKQAEATLRQSEEQLLRAAERDAFRLKLSDALRSLADPDDIEETVTQAAMEHFGADRCYYCEIENGEAIIRRDAARDGLPSVAGVYPLSSFAILQAVIEAGHPFVVRDVRTTDTVDEDLRQICLQLQVISYINVPVIKHGKPVGTLCLVQSTPRDWTDLEVELAIETADRTWAAVERARAEAALRESEERRQIALAAAQMGTFVWFPQEDRGEPDARMLALFGLREGDVLNLAEAIATMIHPGDRDLYAAAVTQALDPNGDGKLYAETRVIHPDDSLHWVTVTERTIFEGQPPQPVRMYGIAADITARKQAEADRHRLMQEQAARYEAEQASRMKDEFLSMVSHELQSPLVAILGWTRMMRATPPSPAHLAKKLEIIERNATLQAKLVQDLLDISRMTADKLRLTLYPVDLQAVLEDAIASINHLAIAKGVDFRFVILDFELEANNPKSKIQNPKFPVLADRDRLQQVFFNLLVNAIKFTPESGCVIVELSAYIGGDLSEDAYAQIRVMDTGIGIAAEFLPHVFDRFRQAETSGSAGGLGLGLAIARYLVELHHGTIEATSQGPGCGSTFTVKLPLSRSEP